ncbi:RNA-binding protein lark isoform X1 [Ixodes scapularis]|uniref:RNA-binding protein lark isoform X1 n=1 Tax=Ixodes scapularis TaxID=6945 RepID=UPI001C380220|nr:RNA-binding protein lark isoform X1 [Ixodes scapularis]
MGPRTKLFVGHLPDGLRTEELQELFAKYGTVTECDVINKYGFVHMSTEEECEEALKNLNNYNFMGSTLSVERSTSKFHQEPGAPGRAKGGPRPPYGGQRNGYEPRPAGGYYNGGGPGAYGDYRRGGADLYDRGPYRAMAERPRPYPVPYERREDPYAPRRPPPGPPSMGPDMYERRPSQDYHSLYTRRSPPPASGSVAWPGGPLWVAPPLWQTSPADLGRALGASVSRDAVASMGVLCAVPGTCPLRPRSRQRTIGTRRA